jgi:3-mercaptopyruvate sulfurtransferase SseA
MDMPFRQITVLTVFLVIAGAAQARADGLPLRYVNDPAAAGGGALILDTRPTPVCAKQSLAGARCLSAADFLGPHGRLADFAAIAWVLGSAGLSGAQSVLVVGGDPRKRDFVAGLLYLMGQTKVFILTRRLKAAGLPFAPGEERDQVRRVVWQAPARTAALVLGNELRALLASRPEPVVLDGRSEKAYWGETVNAARGGHIAGADLFPAARLRADVARGSALGPRTENAIVYARNAVDGIAYMTLIMAGTGTHVRVYPGGWAEWAANGWPADAVTYPPPPASSPPSVNNAAPVSVPVPWRYVAATGVMGIFLGIVLAIGALRMLKPRGAA